MFASLFRRAERTRRPARVRLHLEALEERALLTSTTIDFAVASDWGSGFTGDIAITNNQTTALKDWTLGFRFPYNLTSIWNAGIRSHVGDRYVIEAASWNKEISPGSKVSFGFVGDPGKVSGKPTDYVFTAVGLSEQPPPPPPLPPAPPPAPSTDFQFKVTDDWGSGYVAELTVTNKTATPLTNWTVAFDFGHGIGSSWNATQTNKTGNRYTFAAPDWNKTLAAGASATFGFSGTPGNVKSKPTNLVLSGTPGSDVPPPPPPPPPSNPGQNSSAIHIAGFDSAQQLYQITVDQGTRDLTLSLDGKTNAKFKVATNNRDVIQPEMVGDQTLRLRSLTAGRASLRLEETTTGAVRYVGVRVRTADGQIPGLPDYLAMGSVSEDTTADLGFWQDYTTPGQNKRMDIRYIYLNGGPVNGWRTWGADGQRVVSYIHESQKLGMVPYFVWYNIPDGGESYYTDLQHIQDDSYMQAYFRDLKYALDLIAREAPDDPVGFLLEPDFLGYMMQNSGTTTDRIAARTQAAYSSGVLDSSRDPAFANTVQGLVQAINYTISKVAPKAQFGWQFNLWASAGTGSNVPGNGLMHFTDTLGIDAGRTAIRNEAKKIADYYVQAGILSYGADFVSIDKYGLDAGAQNGAGTNPASSYWFWNADHWNNYLLFSKVLHETTGLPVVLWQIPVGHINGSQAVNPYDSSGRFPDLTNQYTKYEDSAPSFFLGDRFTASGNRLTWFATNRGNDPRISVSGSTVTWGNHLAEAKAAGIRAILFGAGVGDSTDGVGSPPTDGYWWISKVEEYFSNPVRW